MKRLFFCFILISLVSIPMFSQSFQGGFSGGLNASRVDNDGHERYGKMGLNAGFFVAREIMDDQLFWQMELKYSSRGKYDREIDFPYSVYIMDLRYIELPLSLHYFINEKFQIELGLAPDMLIKEDYYDEDGPLPFDSNQELDRFGLTAFVGLNYFVNDKFAIGTRFNYSVFPFYTFTNFTAVRYRDRGLFHDVLSVNLKYYIQR